MNIKDKIHLKQEIAIKLGMDAHAPAIEVAKRYMDSKARKILADDAILNNKKSALEIIVKIHERFDGSR